MSGMSGMSPAGGTEHIDVGAYALGLLEEPDRRAFEAHLAGCPPCQAELGELGGVAAALRASQAGEATAGGRDADRPPAEVLDLVRHAADAERRRRRGTYVIGAVAASAVLAAGILIGGALADDTKPAAPVARGHSGHVQGQSPGGPSQGPAQALVIWGERFSATNAATGLTGTVGLENKLWGTHVGLELGGIRGPLRCYLVAVSRGGEETVVTGWKVPRQGYGVPGQLNPLVTHGGTPTSRSDLVRFAVKDGAGKTLLVIPV